MGELAIAGDDEQGVVDPDAQSDHQPDEGGEVGNRHDIREEGGDPDTAGGDAGESDPDRQAHGEDRSERDDQHHDRERDADQLGLGRLELSQRVAADLDAKPVDGGREVPDLGTDLGRLGLVDFFGEVDLGERGTPVRRDLLRADRVVGTDEIDPFDGIDFVEQSVHLCDHCRVVDACVRLEDDRATELAGGTGEVRLDGFEATARFRGRAGEHAVERCSYGSPEGVDAEDEHQPHADDGAPVPDAPTGQGSKHRRHL